MLFLKHGRSTEQAFPKDLSRLLVRQLKQYQGSTDFCCMSELRGHHGKSFAFSRHLRLESSTFMFHWGTRWRLTCKIQASGSASTEAVERSTASVARSTEAVERSTEAPDGV